MDKKPDKEYLINPTLKISFNVSTEVRGIGKIESKINVSPNDELFETLVLLSSFKGKQKSIKIPEKYIKDFICAGILIEISQIPNNITYKCNFSGKISEKYKQIIADNYTINKNIFIQDSEILPEPIKKYSEYINCLSKEKPVLWVLSPYTKNYLPFWINKSELKFITDLYKNDFNIKQFNEEEISKLINTEILIPEKDYLFESEKQALIKDNFVILKNVINRLQLKSLKEYFRELRDKGYFKKGDNQVNNRDSMPNEPTTMFFHHQFNNLINLIVPEKVKPSYCFVSTYHSEAELKKHKDREQCLWNVSLVIDNNPEPEIPWSIFFEEKGKVIDIKLQPGDAVIYKGNETWHWRDKLPKGYESTIIFFHFVRENFHGSLI